MKSPGATRPSKSLAYTAALCLAVCWFLVSFFALASVFVIVAIVFGLLPWHLNIGTKGNHIVLAWYSLLIVCGVGYNVLALTLRCHYCGHRFLQNPKGLGSAFVYHGYCVGKRGFSPWTVQVAEFVITRRIRCVNCGEEIF
jgi:DNA-directed RNA polymerase subunit RPC12/RpoP